MAGGGGAVDQARHQRQRNVQGSSHARTRRSVTGQATVHALAAAESTPIFPRPAGGPAVTTVFANAEASAWVGGSKLSMAPASSANHACQQNEKAQQTNCQWRRIARSLRTMKSAQPSSCLTCL